MGYTPLQDEILQKFQELGLEEGMYILGMPDPSSTREEQKATLKTYEGKPWAVINYQMNNSMPMVRGYLGLFCGWHHPLAHPGLHRA